jgi:hypothetical protein
MPPALQHPQPCTWELPLEARPLLGTGDEGVTITHYHQGALLNLQGGEFQYKRKGFGRRMYSIFGRGMMTMCAWGLYPACPHSCNTNQGLQCMCVCVAPGAASRLARLRDVGMIGTAPKP